VDAAAERPLDCLRAPVDAIHVNEIGAGGLVMTGETNGDFVVLADATDEELYKANLGGAHIELVSGRRTPHARPAFFNASASSSLR